MTFYDRYINGEDSRLVYADIYALGPDAFGYPHADDINKVLIETFNRLAYNLNIIYTELKQGDYVFYDHPVTPPSVDTDALLAQLEEVVADFGHLPLSLKLFYRTVGACNLSWDYDADPQLRWDCADPLQIDALRDVVDYVADNDWREYMQEIMDDDYSALPRIELAPDYLHKDNISGGEPYSIALTPEPAVDSLFLNEAHETTFIDYLRICMENCGFSNIADPQYQNSYQAFFDKVKPQLKAL